MCPSMILPPSGWASLHLRQTFRAPKLSKSQLGQDQSLRSLRRPCLCTWPAPPSPGEGGGKLNRQRGWQTLGLGTWNTPRTSRCGFASNSQNLFHMCPMQVHTAPRVRYPPPSGVQGPPQVPPASEGQDRASRVRVRGKRDSRPVLDRPPNEDWAARADNTLRAERRNRGWG